MGWWRRSPKFLGQAYAVNVVMIVIGVMLTAWQLVGYYENA